MSLLTSTIHQLRAERGWTACVCRVVRIAPRGLSGL